MENKDKRKKLTLSISGSIKKPKEKIEIAKTHNKNSVIVGKKNTKFGRSKPVQFQDRSKSHPSINTSKPRPFSPSNDFEKRKLAEQRATRRLKGEAPSDKDFKNKVSGKKREYKLTLSRALNEDDSEFKARSMASIKRAKQKENRLTNNEKKEISLKPIQRNVNIPEVITIREEKIAIIEKK